VRRAYFSLGSNVGDRVAHLRQGVRTVAAGDLHRVSQVYETDPVSDISQDDFLNLVLEVETDATPHDLLERARAAERVARRVRTVRDGPRTLDVDVLLVGEETCDDAELTVPHPRMWERRFVLVPLAELAPELVTQAHLAAAVGAVRPLGTLDALR
jgi:2-amino-4-hydroxy-6-hydroxymethyldihydropteridine diphosphokinase